MLVDTKAAEEQVEVVEDNNLPQNASTWKQEVVAANPLVGKLL